MTRTLASAITKAASTQTWLTIRLLVDRARVEDAYRAYAYYRWVDDVLDAVTTTGWAHAEDERRVRARFLDRQKALLAASLDGVLPADVDPHERLLVDLVRRRDAADGGLESYLRTMMRVMEFDVGRRGRLVSRQELDEYTRWLAIAVTDAMHHFVGHDDPTPADDRRYLAVTGAHIVHMLRDTFADLEAGYFNVPREVLEAASIGPRDVQCDAYRAWVRDRAQQARVALDGGRAFYARIPSARHRLAGLAYIARFERVLDRIERDEFRIRREYSERRRLSAAVSMAGSVALALLPRPHPRDAARPLEPARHRPS
ncbi:MAG TPA: squalene/phytoene synthase family protein [Candidatus Limnocylindrales bacterium]|nr:squalene/phytoene synthase family protein [Candidatus Limnocylindrales bacterium]